MNRRLVENLLRWTRGKSALPVVSVMMICTANICRSPMAQGILQALLTEAGLDDRVVVESAGTHVSRAGDRVDPRARNIALARGVDLGKLRGRQVRKTDFAQYDYFLVMDNNNYRALVDTCPSEYRHKLIMIMDFAPEYGDSEVPDPYYGSAAAFEDIYNRLEVAIRGFVQQVLGDIN